MDPKALEVIERLGTKLSSMGEKAFTYAVKGIVAQGWVDTTYGVVILLITSVVLWKMHRYAQRMQEHEIYIGVVLLGICGYITGSSFLWHGIVAILAPEWVLIEGLIR